MYFSLSLVKEWKELPLSVRLSSRARFREATKQRLMPLSLTLRRTGVSAETTNWAYLKDSLP